MNTEPQAGPPADATPASAMTVQVVPVSIEALELEERSFALLQRKAELAANSRCYPDAVTLESAAIKMMTALTLRVDPMVALTDIRVYEGKPELSSGLTAAILQREGYSWAFVEHNEKVCRAKFYFHGQPLLDASGTHVEFGFTIEQAQRAGYDQRGLSKDGKNNYHKVPENMLFARMITNFCKFYCPWVTRGMSIYSPGEVEMAVQQRGGPEAQAAGATQQRAEDLKSRLADRKVVA